MMNFLGAAAPYALLVLVWFVIPVVVAPLVLLAALATAGCSRRRHAAAAAARHLDVHEAEAVHPASRRLRIRRRRDEVTLAA